MFLSCVEAPPAVNTTVARHSAQPNQYSHTPYGQANSSGDTPLTSPRLIHEFTSCLPYHPCRPFHPCLLLVASWVLPWESRWRHIRLSSAVTQHLMRPPALCGPPDQQQQQNIHGVINPKCLQINSWRYDMLQRRWARSEIYFLTLCSVQVCVIITCAFIRPHEIVTIYNVHKLVTHINCNCYNARG